MRLAYRKVLLELGFPRPVVFPVYPAFVLRSLLGKELRAMACLFKDRACASCTLRASCAYGYLYETPAHSGVQELEGRDRASHPFALWCVEGLLSATHRLQVELTLIGGGIRYLPYLVHSFVRAGRKGILRERLPFSVEGAAVEGHPIFSDDRTSLDMDSGVRAWSLEQQGSPYRGRIEVELLSPLRLKVRGRYGLDFGADDLFAGLRRRAAILCAMYGDSDGSEPAARTPRGLAVAARRLRWVDLPYYSARQGERLRMGGAVGTLILEGEASPPEMALLRFGEIFHAGKNTSFGLGRMRVRSGPPRGAGEEEA